MGRLRILKPSETFPSPFLKPGLLSWTRPMNTADTPKPSEPMSEPPTDESLTDLPK